MGTLSVHACQRGRGSQELLELLINRKEDEKRGVPHDCPDDVRTLGLLLDTGQAS